MRLELRFLVMALVLWGIKPALAQTSSGTQPDEGVRFNPPDTMALVHAHIVISGEREIEEGTLVIRDGRIEQLGTDITPPAGAEVIDCGGDYLYPAFIDALVEFDATSFEPRAGHWNAQITPQRKMSHHVQRDTAKLEMLRKAGMGIVLAAPQGGIMKGQSCVISTGAGPLERSLLREQGFQHIRLYPSRGSRSNYPNSPMGAVALVRQTLADAQWYQDAGRAVAAQPELLPPEFNEALAALQPVVNGEQAVVMDGTNELYALRADRIAREFALKLIVRGSGREYRRLDAIAATNRTYILPVEFPDAPELESQEEWADATLQELVHWNLAPENPARLHQAGVDFVLSSDGLSSANDFWDSVRQAVRRGLAEDVALDALTLRPARMLGVDSIAGTLERGKMANILRSDKPLFQTGAKLKETWVRGARHVWEDSSQPDLRGVWELTLAGHEVKRLDVEVAGTPSKPKARIGLPGAFEPREDEEEGASQGAGAEEETAEVAASNADEEPQDTTPEGDSSNTAPTKPAIAKVEKLQVSEYRWSGTLDAGEIDANLRGTAILSGTLLGNQEEFKMTGTLLWPDGTLANFSAVRLPPNEIADSADSSGEEKDDAKSKPSGADQGRVAMCEVNYPLGAYGVAARPEQPEWVLFRGATIWTCSEQGILPSADLLVHGGVIEAVGENLKAPDGATVIEAAGMHLSPGIIDCHSHMATDGGVNESGQAVTAEVRIGDFIDPNDITIYRQLAGGVTTSNILHGSANPIGGQNQVIKLRWGSLGEEMKMSEAPAGIKFALGENVKQSNRGDAYRTRYPQTRMGVEQIMRDRFEAAKLYRKRWKDWTSQPTGLPPRTDYELEAIAEILEGTRWIHCHSYRQDEILTMLRTLEDYEVTIGSLQHILEGYKVADAMAAHGATGSSFSDWWAYKFEVYDAIAYNGAIMHRAGVIVSFNSDDRELARHLNHEAAKAVKYGGVPQEEALKFVTLNPAKQLRIDRWVGSLEPGKHADLVVWNRSPLSTLSACMQTWIDGRKYFDRQEDLQRRKEDARLHRKLAQYVVDSDAITGERKDNDPSYWWARYDEFCHHGHGDQHDEHHD